MRHGKAAVIHFGADGRVHGECKKFAVLMASRCKNLKAGCFLTLVCNGCTTEAQNVIFVRFVRIEDCVSSRESGMADPLSHIESAVSFRCDGVKVK
jgi:hypothetical protein